MGWFRPFGASPDLRGVLDCRYVATTDGRHDLIPDGSVELLWTDRVGAVLCGPDTRSWSFELPPGTDVAGVRFRPGAAAATFRLDATDVKDQRVGLADVLGAAVARVVGERLAAAPDPVERMIVLEDLVRRRNRNADPDGTVELAALVASDPAYGVEGLAQRTGVSTRQLRRRFDRTVGYGSAFFARIARLQRFARAAARQPQRGVAELAVMAGYADQPHLARDCRDIAGMTPRQLVAVVPRTSLAVTLGDFRAVREARPNRSAA